MSRIGKKPIIIPEGVNVSLAGNDVGVKGPKGELKISHDSRLTVTQKEKTITVERKSNDYKIRALHGLTRCLINNMIEGVTKGFEKKLEIKGVGYKASVQGEKLVLALGFSHPVEITAPAGITFQVQKNIITISGIDKQLVGQIAANIRAFKKPEPYKGKGIRYIDEIIKRKAGKAAKAAGTTGA